jgi:hypothetical protein
MTNRNTANEYYLETPHQIDAYVSAAHDRMKWRAGIASEQEIPEPPHGKPTLPPPPRAAVNAGRLLR